MFARIVFLLAGLYGVTVMFPMYFMEQQWGQTSPPAMTHPEFYYGFIGCGLAWQLVFLLMAWDFRRFRPLVYPALVEKFSFALAAIVLFAQSRLTTTMLAAGMVDLMLGALMAITLLPPRQRR